MREITKKSDLPLIAEKLTNNELFQSFIKYSLFINSFLISVFIIDDTL